MHTTLGQPRQPPYADARDAPDLPGTIRLTLLLEDGEGTSAYFDPASLPETMRTLDQAKDVRTGRTMRAVVETDERRWARFRAVAIERRLEDPQGSMTVLLWLYCRHPKTPALASVIHETLAEHGRACLTVAHNRRTGTIVAAVAPGFHDGAVPLSGLDLPDGTNLAVLPREHVGGRA